MAREKKNFFSYCALPSRLLSYSKIMQTRGMRACYQIPECSLSYTKIVKGECNGKRKEEFLFILHIGMAFCGIFK